MTREYANELLYLWKVGAQVYPPQVIKRALCATGDLMPSGANKSDKTESQPSVTWRTSRAGGNSEVAVDR